MGLFRSSAAKAPASASETVLVFPAGVPDALAYRAAAQARGVRVIGASSLAFDPAAGGYDGWVHLPFVHDPGFETALCGVIGAQGVDAVYAPHEVVAGVLADSLPRLAPQVRLIEDAPLLRAEAAYRQRLAAASAAAERGWFALTGGRAAMSPVERAGLLRLVDTIPGMTDGDKTDALFEAMRHAPAGDVVEVGSWWGRSAALLLGLSRRYRIGPVLCVDPWRDEHLPQGVEALDRASARLDADMAFQIFQMNLAPLAGGDLNVLRAPSVEAAASYRPGLEVESETFGKTRYSGRIALLHIDGNHAYDSVLKDAAAWTPHVAPGGWIVFDDYVWAFGDGPRQVGDAYLASQAGRIELSFVIGTALFVKLAT